MAKKKPSVTDFRPLIRQAMLTVFKEHPSKWFNYKQVLKRVVQDPFNESASLFIDDISEDELKVIVMEELEAMSFSGELEDGSRGKYRLFPVENFVTGKIDVTSSGNAYVINENFEEDIFIAKGSTLNALKGDIVKVSLYAKKKGQRNEGEVVEVVERARNEFAGVVQVSERFAFLSSENYRGGGVDIFIPLSKLNGAVNGQKAVAKITEWLPDAKNPQGEIVKVLGKPGDNDTEMDAILVEYGFPLHFPTEVEKEAEEIPFEIPAKEIKKRRDFRKITTFTIDPADAKDFDDALSIQWLPNGNMEVGVHIADVSYYVRPGSHLDEEGYDRATSIYLVDRVIPMLPEKLSNNVCSLRPGEDKLTYSAVFEINDEAQVISEWFGRTIIHSQKRFTYEEAQAVIETGKGPLQKEILAMQALAVKMRKERFKNGAITFEKVEVKFRLDEKGMPIDVYLKENKDSNKLIEEFMLLANRKVAEFVGKKLLEKTGKEHPFVYRIHDTPSGEKLDKFALFAARFGHKINTRTDREVAHSLNKLMKDIKGSREQNVLEQLAIRTMAKAIYTTDNIGHYGLAFDYYTHFTSPIRRYPDVMVHRLLDYYLKDGKPADAEQIEEQCKHSTEMEIKASEAERASIKFKQAQYLMGREGEIFDGMISGVTEWGIYVELIDSKCEGLIRVRDLKDDFYELDEVAYCLVGHRYKKRYQLGDTLRVKLKSADLLKKQIDFVLEDDIGIRFDKGSRPQGNPKKSNSEKKSKPRGFAKEVKKKKRR
ncbi:MAG TPA: ribonuclease R [Bacteroidia bacterium]|nr:ribonuclease R [Bacteroidia bacterium]HQK98004.1 ribonuclease R [Bacteroidia bacterium]